jgi:hypothetical protein
VFVLPLKVEVPQGALQAREPNEHPKGLPRLWEVFSPGQWQPKEKTGLEHYLLIGFDDDAGNPICIDEQDGKVVSIEHELLFDPKAGDRRVKFVNSSVLKLAECLLAYQRGSSQTFRPLVQEIDEAALKKGAFWTNRSPD